MGPTMGRSKLVKDIVILWDDDPQVLRQLKGKIMCIVYM